MARSTRKWQATSPAHVAKKEAVEEQKVTDMEPIVSDTVSIYNKGTRAFITSSGALDPGKSMTIPADEASVLLKYPEILKTGDVPSKDNRSLNQLKAENDRLKAELDKLRQEGGGKTPEQ
jgi:hypothetical protein